MPLTKARMQQLDSALKDLLPGGKDIEVQFNPETLKVSFSNQVQTPTTGGDQRGPQPRLVVGAGVTKLTVQLWFDASSPSPAAAGGVADVRELTQGVAFFITPIQEGQQLIAPNVRFLWGSFKFDGTMESFEENLEFFSAEGRPLRASVSFSLSQQRMIEYPRQGARGARPLTPAPEGSTLQGLAGGAGFGQSWQPIAAANAIEDPLRLTAGQLIDLNLKISVR